MMSGHGPDSVAASIITGLTGCRRDTGQWVDRSQELAIVRAEVEALRHGEGAAVWVEGEPGWRSSVRRCVTASRPNGGDAPQDADRCNHPESFAGMGTA